METTANKYQDEVTSIILPVLAVADILSIYEFLTSNLHHQVSTVTFQAATRVTSDSDSHEIWLKVYSNGDVEYAWSSFEPYKTLGNVVTYPVAD